MTGEKTTMTVHREDLERLDVIRIVDHVGDGSVPYRELLNDALDVWADNRDVDFDEFKE